MIRMFMARNKIETTFLGNLELHGEENNTRKFILKIIELSKIFFLFSFWGSVGKHVSQPSKYEKVWDHYIKDSVL
jgi:hypothetical protein